MPVKLTTLAALSSIPADTIIDVRSPTEFTEDHLPGAINLPVLSDAERAEVGTIYAQDSAFRARKIGAALLSANAARHLQGPLADKPGEWQPLVYCWRGGQRSDSFATILDQIGWRVRLVEGGYRSYRTLVVNALYTTPLLHKLCVIEGGTGTAKTRLLEHLREAGAQVIDLEGIAQHRGSLFGGLSQDQPSQKMFESHLATALGHLDPAQTTWIEAESSKIGARLIPPSLWARMCAAPRVELHAPLDARADFLCRAYADLTQDAVTLHRLIDKLRPYHAAETIASWQACGSSGDFATLAARLVSEHYDPRYAKSATRSDTSMRAITLDDLSDATLASAARALTSQTIPA
ncbi:tRNA 2-selenouridine(34) synthase MnmH [Sulfitobacter sp. SK012]|uniref:tRNA 2-selenouridine(34) synthase MnmH n=1 Tax=Sulfitobacter sp. SK012 TaxID=1389005 RepID=UPI003F904C92